MDDVIVPVIALLCVFGMPAAIIVIPRMLAHRERLEMIRHGITPPPDPRAARRAARYGWQVPPNPTMQQNSGNAPPPPFAGGFAQQQGYYFDDRAVAQIQLRKGIRLTLIGAALLMALGIAFHSSGSPLLFGLIPMFVGIAQVISAVLNGAQVPGFANRWDAPPGQTYETPFRNDPRSAGPAPSQPPPSGPYAWRPGSTTPIEHDKNDNAGP